MSPSDPGPVKAQARTLLQALCKFILPSIQTVVRENGIDVEEISCGAAADELVIELEKFVSAIISHSRSHKELAMEVALEKPLIYYPEVPTPDIPFEQSNTYAVARPIRDLEEDREVSEQLQNLRKDINQKMPIRLLCFEPHNSKLKISLLNRNEIYDYLAQKIRRKDDSRQHDYTAYAILSHTWTQSPGELTYGDWQRGPLDDSHPKCQKLISFCKVAWEKHGLTLGWIDTVCINKESSAELDESIRSMYAWYSNANVCITYLAGTNILSDMHNDPWFTRGWTLQELFAPYYIKFYNKNWKQLSRSPSSSSDKHNPLIQQEINLATTITEYELLHIRDKSISRRMKLAAKRHVTREEDIAYCLMGIFDVSILTAYGEGAERAFFRLVEEIFRSTKDVCDIFNWAGERKNGSRQPTTSLFPSRPSDYLHRLTSKQLRPWRPMQPLTLTHLGLRIPILLMPAVPTFGFVLSRNHYPIGDYHATVSIAPFNDNDDPFEVPQHYHLLDKRLSEEQSLYNSESSSWEPSPWVLTLGTLNVEDHQGTSIRIPKTCLAVLLKSARQLSLFHLKVQETSSLGYSRIYTEKPIAFDLKKIGNDSDDDENDDYYELERSELEKHGMELVTLYL